MIYGSGLRNGDANIDALAPYAQFNVGLKRDFAMPDGQPVTVRFDVVNIFDTIYQIRNGTGIGVFSPQYGPRRGYFIGIKKKICADPSASDCRNTAQMTGETMQAASNGRPLLLLSRTVTIGPASMSGSTPEALSVQIPPRSPAAAGVRRSKNPASSAVRRSERIIRLGPSFGALRRTMTPPHKTNRCLLAY